MPKHRLSKMRIDRISLVDRPAHPDAEVVIAKRDESQDNLETFDKNTSFFVEDDNIQEGHPEEDLVMEKAYDMEGDEDEKPRSKKKMPKDVLEHFRSMSKAEEEEIVLSEEQDDIELEDEELTKAFDEMLAGLPAEAVEYIEKLEDSLVDAMKKADADMDDEEEEDEDEDEMEKADDADAIEADDEIVLEEEDADEVEKFLKSADPRLAEIVKSAVSRAEAAETIAKRERDLRLEKEFIAKADDLSHLPAKADEVVALLKAVNDGAPRAAGAFEELLKRCNSALAEGAIYKSEGQSETGEAATVVARWDSAVEAVRKSDDSLSYEQAFASALDQNPELYEEYLTGKGR